MSAPHRDHDMPAPLASTTKTEPGGAGASIARRAGAALMLILSAALAACGSSSQRLTSMPVAEDANGQPARLLSAFFGLDDALPITATRLCRGAPGRDGIPVVLSHTIDAGTLQREDFAVVTQSGAEHTPLCVTLAPASDPGELRTVLLVGDFGSAGSDPPVTVRIVDDLVSDGATGGPVNFRGTAIRVVPIEAGPTLVLAEVVSRDEWSTIGRNAGASCPAGTQQIVRTIWAGGVRLPNGEEVGDAERALYRVSVEHPDGSLEDVVPVALADLDDHDNNHRLCLGTSDRAVSVFFPAGHVVDPNGDLNPETRASVTVESQAPGPPAPVARDRRWR